MEENNHYFTGSLERTSAAYNELLKLRDGYSIEQPKNTNRMKI